MRRISITYKIAFVLSLIATSPMILYSRFTAFQESTRTLQSRVLSCEQFSRICSLYIQTNASKFLGAISSDLLKRDASIAGIRITRQNGSPVCRVGKTPLQVSQPNSRELDQKRIALILYSSQQPWGNLEVFYHQSPMNEDYTTVAVAATLIFILNTGLFSLALRRYLSVIDTAKVVPTRVRNTLDTIPDGIVILNADGRTIVTNEAFQNSSGLHAHELVGSDLKELPFVPVDGCLPWDAPDKSSQTHTGIKVVLENPHGSRYFSVGCSPILDAREQHAGNLVCFQDITLLEQQKQILELTLRELGESKERLEEQNVKLHELASKDMLTGVFNRRFLFEHLELYWNLSVDQNHTMSVVMFDVDHFKKLNDEHGHSVGDQVLRNVAAVITGSVPESAVVGRYGGEEFCVILPDLDASGATQAAESIRHAIQNQLAQPYRVTASIGVATKLADVTSYQMMLDRADKALYAAKHSGRNAVKCWSVDLELNELNGRPVKPTARAASSRLPPPPSEISPEKELADLVEELKEISPSPCNPQTEPSTGGGPV